MKRVSHRRGRAKQQDAKARAIGALLRKWTELWQDPATASEDATAYFASDEFAFWCSVAGLDPEQVTWMMRNRKPACVEDGGPLLQGA